MNSILIPSLSRHGEFSRHGEPEEENFPSTVTTSPDRCTVYSLSLSNTSETAEISDRQVRWDQEASIADAKQTQLFHSQWTLIREQSDILRDQITSLTRDFANVRTEVKSLQESEEKSRLTLQQHAELLTALQEEPRLRREADEKLAAELKDKSALLADAISNEAKDRIAGIREVANQAKQSVDQEIRDRTAADEELARQLQATVDAVEREVQSNTGLRSHVNSLQQDLMSEKSVRADDDAALKRALQGLEVAAMEQMKDLRISIEAEIAARGAADSRIEKGQEDVQRLIEVEGGKRMRLAEDVEKNLGILKTDFEQETKSHSGQVLQLTNGQQKLKDLLEAECGNRAKAMNDIGDRLRNLSESLLSESKDRSCGDQELKKEIICCREALDNEARQRAAGNRELKDALQAETALRAEADEKSKAGWNGLASRLESELTVLRETVAKEARDRSAADDELSRIDSQLKTAVEGEVHTLRDADARLANDIREGLRQLAEALTQERSERTAGDEDNGRQVLTIKQGLEKEIKDRASADGDLRAILAELAQNLDKQQRESAAGHDAFTKELERTRSELANEKATRSDALSVIGLAVQTLDANTTQQLKDLLAKLEAETKARNALDSSVEKQLVDLTQTLREETAARTSGENNHDKFLHALRQDLDAEAKERSMGDEAIGNALKAEAAQRSADDETVSNSVKELMNKMSQAFDGMSEALQKESMDRDAVHNEIRQIEERLKAALEGEARLRQDGDEKDASEWREAVQNLWVACKAETRDRANATDQLIRNSNEIMASLDREINSRTASDEDFLKHLQELKAVLEREQDERERGAAALQKGLQENKQELTGEKGERSQADEALRKELRTTIDTLNAQLRDALVKLDREMSTRDLAIQKHEKDHNDLRASHETEVSKRAKSCDDADKRLCRLNADLEEEGKLRVASDNCIRELISIEKSERVATDEATMHRLSSALVKLDSGVESFRELMQMRFSMLASKLEKPRVLEPSKVTTFYIGED